MIASRFLILAGLLLASFAPTMTGADPATELPQFSDFKASDAAEALSGKVKTIRGPEMKGPRDLAVECLYFVPLPVEKTVDLLRRWNGTRHSELKVYLHGNISGQISADDFKSIASAPKNASVRAFVSAMQGSDSKSPGLQMSQEEAKRAPRGDGSGTMTAEIGSFWSNLLTERARAFASSGLAGQPPYARGGETVSVSNEVNRLLQAEPKVRQQFSRLLGAASFNRGGGLKPSLYWTMFDVEDQAALTLGAVYAQAMGDGRWQMLDLQYYSSGGHFALVTFYQLWPAKDGTLVWREDRVSAPALGELRGVERLGSSSVMMKQIAKSTNYLIQDAKR
jgi:hypothetical protein